MYSTIRKWLYKRSHISALGYLSSLQYFTYVWDIEFYFREKQLKK